jgi:hypothetical protein
MNFFIKNNFEKKSTVNKDGKVAPITDDSECTDLITVQCFVAEGDYVFITEHRKEAVDTAVGKIGEKNMTVLVQSLKQWLHSKL